MGLELGFPHIDARRFLYKQRDALVLKAQAFNQPQADDGLAQAHPIAQKRAVKPMTSIFAVGDGGFGVEFPLVIHARLDLAALDGSHNAGDAGEKIVFLTIYGIIWDK